MDSYQLDYYPVFISWVAATLPVPELYLFLRSLRPSFSPYSAMPFGWKKSM
jgi:hypothetical protein